MIGVFWRDLFRKLFHSRLVPGQPVSPRQVGYKSRRQLKRLGLSLSCVQGETTIANMAVIC
jgi:hypothetical protein